MAGWIQWAASAVLATGIAVGSQFQLQKVPPPVLDVNMLFVPPAQLTRGFASGHENVVADGLWLGLLQYYGDRVVMDDKHCVNLAAMFGLITDLDPHFWFAYWLGSWALSDNGEGDAAATLMVKGEKANPGDYNYPYMLGFVHFLGRHDYKAAAEAFERAAGLPDAPRFARTMAARMYEKQGHDVLALQVWQNLADNPATDATTRQIAKRNVARIQAEMARPAPGDMRKRGSSG